jgi:hypothetical protein
VQIVSFLRQHAHYLTPTPKLGIFALVANALRAVLFSLGLYFAMLVIVMVLAFGTGLDFKLPELGRVNLFVVLGLLALLGAAAVTVIYSVGSHFVKITKGHDSATGEPIRRYYHRFSIPLTIALGWLLQIQIACAAFGSLPFTYGWAERHGGGDLYGAISVAIAYLGTCGRNTRRSSAS